MEEKVRQFQIDHSDPPPDFTPLEPTIQDSKVGNQGKQRGTASKRGGKQGSTVKSQGDRGTVTEKEKSQTREGATKRVADQSNSGKGKGKGRGPPAQRRGRQGEKGIASGSTAESKGRGGRNARPAQAKDEAPATGAATTDREAKQGRGTGGRSQDRSSREETVKKNQKRGKATVDQRKGEGKRDTARNSQANCNRGAKDSAPRGAKDNAPRAPTVHAVYPLQAPPSYPITYNLLGTVSDVCTVRCIAGPFCDLRCL